MESETCTIGRSVIVKGELSAEENLTIEGQVEGTIVLSGHCLTIGENASIRANMTAKKVIVLGRVNGDITADETITIRETAVVAGKLDAPRVGMAEGASFRGQVDMQRRDTREAESTTRPQAAPSTPQPAAATR